MISVTAKLDTPFVRYRDGLVTTMQAAVQGGIEAAALGLKVDMRNTIARAGLGRRLGNAVRSKVYPQGAKKSLGAAGLVYARGPSANIVLTVFSQGATIRATGKLGGRMLAIPTPNVPVITTSADGRGIKRRPMTPVEVEAHFDHDLVTIPSHKGRGAAILAMPAVAAASRGKYRRATRRRLKGNRRIGRRERQLVPMFVLVPVVHLAKRFDADQLARKWLGQVPLLIERALPTHL